MDSKNKERLSTLGLVLITVWSAVQYIFLRNVPDTLPQFSFLCITNLLGLCVLLPFCAKKLKKTDKGTVLRGALLSLELMGFSFFLLIGSKEIDSVITSSVISMYFIFVTPLLMLFKKDVSFRSMIASIIGIISLLLIFDADTVVLFSSKRVIFLFIAALFFAFYVVSVSLFCEKEEPAALTVTQLTFGTCYAFIAWLIEIRVTHMPFSLPKESNFWVSALFIGLFIRALYSLIQMTAQKHVQAFKTSLIFASEIIITLILNPFLCRVLGSEYMPVSRFKVVGCVFFVVAMLLVDDEFMKRLGYRDMERITYRNEKNELVKGSSVSRKIINLTLAVAVVALTVSSVVCLSAIINIRNTTVQNSSDLGHTAALESETSLKKELESELRRTASDKASLADLKLSEYSINISNLASYATDLCSEPSRYSPREVNFPLKENGGRWAMQRCLADKSVSYASVKNENVLMGNMEDVFKPIVKDKTDIATIYLGTESGLLVSYDIYSDTAYTGGESYYEYRNSDWYKAGKASENAAFTAPYQDGYGRGLTITCFAPFFNADGSVNGVIAMDILIGDFNSKLIKDCIDAPGSAMLLDSEGKVIASPDLAKDSDKEVTIYDKEFKNSVRAVADTVFSKSNGVVATSTDEDAVYVAYSTVSSTGWKLCISMPVSNVIEPAVKIRDSIDSNTSNVTELIESAFKVVFENCLVLIAAIILVVTVIIGKYTNKISEPLSQLESDVRYISNGDLSYRTKVHTDDEINCLADSFNNMANSLQNHIAELKEVTAKEERISSELAVATNIQVSMLPNQFPPFPGRTDFDIFASMTPAREVGGDFYDFFLIDDRHLGIVMADVSGKGIPASLFMVISKTLIKNRALLGGKPSEILQSVNNQLVESNGMDLFVTAWLGILDLDSGVVTAANAGHEFPVVSKNGKFEFIKDRHGFVLAGMEGSRYTDYEFRLNKGDVLFVYTDGVPEATNAANELFGLDRMLDALNSKPFENCESLLSVVKTSIDGFVNGADQFDDITMLAIQLNN